MDVQTAKNPTPNQTQDRRPESDDAARGSVQLHGDYAAQRSALAPGGQSLQAQQASLAPGVQLKQDPAVQRDGETTDMYTWTENGREMSCTPEEYPAVCDQRLRALRNDAVRQMDRKAGEARILYDHFVELNDDQYIVSWFAETVGGVDMPPLSLITNAERAASSAQQAARGSVQAALNRTVEAVRRGESVINRAVETMRTYREGVISGASLCATTLEVTSAVCFVIAGACGAALLAPVLVAAGASTTLAAAGAGGAAGVGTAVVSNTAHQGGRMAAGLQEDFDFGELAEAVVREGLAGFVGGAAGAAVAARVAPVLARLLTSQLGRTIATEAITRVIKGAAGRTFRGILSDTYTAIAHPERMNINTFLQHLATNLIAGGFAGFLTGRAS